MRFLKKASYHDIVGNNKKNLFHYYDNLPVKYKEFELYLTQSDLKDLSAEEKLKELADSLKKNGAVITAIHCPESMVRTCNEKENDKSSNYLSLCEVIDREESRKLFKDLLVIADKICQGQYRDDAPISDNEEYEETDSTLNKEKSRRITVVLHEGCEIGCGQGGDNTNCNRKNRDFDQWVCDCVDLIDDLKIKNQSFIQIAIENITPFYSYTDVIEKGKNCGWKKENQIISGRFFENINQRLKDKKIQFGACIDFCHIMVSEKIFGKNITKEESIINYFKNIDYQDDIILFHVSNYGEDLSHGQLFFLDNEDDKKALEIIRNYCNENKNVPITFEMADGEDIEKASLNYEHIMFYFSNKHLFGKFNQLLLHEANKELKDFFDELFKVYTCDRENVFEITTALWKIKQIILKNTFVPDDRERLFGFDFDKTEVNLSLVRLKAYIYYARFCNLGNFLADNYYSGEKCIWDEKSDSDRIARDYGLAMKYFMFNDRIHQCVYTGIQYKFLIDFLPKRENFVRFNDGIIKTRKIENTGGKEIFKQVVAKIPDHISGISIMSGEADFYSVGKNFGQCLFKYFNSDREQWSLKIYENAPVNYVDYENDRYSIQAFTQFVLQGGSQKGKNPELSLDISRFASGRDGKEQDSLAGFLDFFATREFVRENVASVSDEEILFTTLPESSAVYRLTQEQGVILKKIFLEGQWQKKGTHCKVEYRDANEKENDESDNMKAAIREINADENHIVWKILDCIRQQVDWHKISKAVLENLNVYSGNDRIIYERSKDKINCRWEE